MGKFESPSQIATLFIGAAVISGLVIFVLNIEAKNRYHNDENKEIIIISSEKIIDNRLPTESSSTEENNENISDDKVSFKNNHSIWARLKKKIKDKIISWLSDEDEKVEENEEEVKNIGRKLMSTNTDILNPPLAETLLTSKINGHKIRHLSSKVRTLSKANDLVKEVLKQYCKCKVENKTVVVHNDLPSPIMSQIRDKKSRLGKDIDPYSKEPIIACQSYGKMLLTVAITTAVNFGFVLFICGCKSLSQYCVNKYNNPNEENGNYTRFENFEYPIITSSVMNERNKLNN